MRRVLLMVFLIVCAGRRAAAAPADDVIARSHALFAAVDGDDVAAAQELLAADVRRLEAGRFANRDQLLANMRDHKERNLPRWQRRWSDESVRRAGATAIYIGHMDGTLERPGAPKPAAVERWVTLVWVEAGGRWQLLHWQSADAGLEAERQIYNDVFQASTVLSLKPNRFLMEVVHGRRPGAALDVGMGQGRNAIYLAGQGWKVTGIDISDEGVRQAREAAARAGLELETVLQDADTWDWGTDRWDLICFIYAGGGKDVVERVRRSLRKGGVLVIEFFHSEDAKEHGFRTNELPELYKDGFKVLRYEEVEDTADWSLHKRKLVRF